MGASVSLQGRFCHDMDPDSSILVSSLGYIEIDQSIELQWGNFMHSDGLLSVCSRDVQSVRCIEISYTFYHQSCMH